MNGGRLLVLFVWGLGVSWHVNASSLPKFITPCRAVDQNLSTCWAGVLENLRPHLITGIRELQVPPIDPFRIPKLFISRRDQRLAAEYDLRLHDIVISGTKDYQVIQVDIDLRSLVIKLRLGFPKIGWFAVGWGKGKVVGYDLEGPITIEMSFSNLTLDFVLDGEEYGGVDGRKFVGWKEGNTTVTYGSMHFLAGEIIRDNLTLQVFNRAMNENVELLAEHGKPVVSNTMGAYIIELLNRVHRLFSIDVLYPAI